ncbi:MAG: DsbA family protein [Candidatus Pacebacteria bacterium]|jgi:protein-disulfide isomerase|nr:DsbA family protein [Candidatus Paceibacterota bacterium]
MKNPWVIIGIIAVLLIGGAVWYSGEANEIYNEGVEVKAHIKGNPDAAVKLVEYSDFQCPACAAFQPVIAEILAEYGDRMSFEYRHFPLTQIHRLAEPAARAAEAAGQQGKFYEYHDLLFVNQTNWSNSTNPAQFFIQYATELDLDIDEFTRVQRSSILRAHVQSQFNEAREQGFTGTPSFLLNGEKMEFSTFDEFRAQIINAIDPSIDVTGGLGAPVGEGAAEAAVPAAPAVQFGI